MPAHIVSQLAHLELLTPDLDRAARFFTDFVGLTASARTATAVYLRAWGETFHHSLQLTASAAAGLGHVAWRASSAAALDAGAAELERVGAGQSWVEGGTGHGRAYRFRTPGGHTGELVWEVERYAAPEEVRSRFRNRPQRRPEASTPARFLHHVNLSSPAVARDRALFADVLGFTCSELIRVPQVGLEVFAGLACTNLDHDLGVTIDPEAGAGRLNHLAYALESREEVLLAADAAVEAGLTIELGPAKHGVGESFFLYVRDPGSQQRVELYSAGYLNFEPDRPTVVWSLAEQPHPLLAWDGELPASFGRGRMAGLARPVSAPADAAPPERPDGGPVDAAEKQ
jgi:catechol 2,3-dioxygenase